MHWQTGTGFDMNMTLWKGRMAGDIVYRLSFHQCLVGTMPTTGKAVGWGMNVYITLSLSRYSLGPEQHIVEPRFTQGK